MIGEGHVCGDRRDGWPSLLCNLVPGHVGDHQARGRAGERYAWPQREQAAQVLPMPHRSGDLTRSRRDATEEACRWLGGTLVEYVTGDYADDDVAELLAQAAAAQLRRHGDTDDEVRADVTRALRRLAQALARMADDADTDPLLLNPGSSR
jgi:hypothetical protein